MVFSLKESLARIIGKSEHIVLAAKRLLSLYHGFKRRGLVAERLEHVRRLMERYGVREKPEGNVLLIVVDCLKYRSVSFAGVA